MMQRIPGERPSVSSRRRLAALAVLGLGLAGLLSARLYRMQVVEGAVWHDRAREGTVRADPLPALRGRILDCRGRLLVGNRPRYSVQVDVDQVPDLAAAARELAPILRCAPGGLLERLRRQQDEAPLEPLTLASSLDRAQLAGAADAALRMPGLVLDARPRRWYPMGRTAAHVLGYTGLISPAELSRMRRLGYRAGDVIGQSGLDAVYDRLLRGRRGARFVATDPAGRSVRVVGVRRPLPGEDLHLTLDGAFQERVERILQGTLDGLAHLNGKRTGGAVVVLDVHSGAVLAMASLPQYDPGFFANRFSASGYAALLRDPLTPLLDRAYQAAFSPGSTFKIINASASLQEKLCTPSTVFFCSGVYKGAHCFARGGHGHIGFYDSIALSCDGTYYRLGDRLGIDRLDRYASAFGLGRRTGLDLPDEEAGLMPNPAWKQEWVHDRWYDGDTINASIGQGFVLVTPLQMACYTAAVANGGTLWQPHLAAGVTDGQGRVVWRFRPHRVRRVPVETRWLAAVREGMRGAVTHGTATVAQSKMVALAGKTGTVETGGRNHVWFTCFGPYQHPRIAVSVFLEKAGGYGGQYAAPIARRVAEAWFTAARRRKPGTAAMGAASRRGGFSRRARRRVAAGLPR